MKKTIIISVVVLGFIIIGYIAYKRLFKKSENKGLMDEWSDHKKDFFEDWAIENQFNWLMTDPWGTFKPKAEKLGQPLDKVVMDHVLWSYEEGNLIIETIEKNHYWPIAWEKEMKLKGLDKNGY